MNATEQISSLKIRPGAKPGQIILGVDLSEAEQASQVLNGLTELGYEPQLRYLELKTGLHVFALLKEEQHHPSQTIDDEYWIDEWEMLANQIVPSTAVRLWRGYPQSEGQPE
ncbi:MAG: hypothetical protein HC827_10625 [Cyanobacteria bacterium RM1_2_2]|nr:hypothetical protein [Cyanobacteria bacterium RM1_2_2]